MNRKQRRAGEKTAPQAVEDLFALAVGHHKAGRIADAQKMFRRMLLLAPGHVGSLHHLGLIAYEAGRHDQAIAYMTEAIAGNDQVSAFHSNLGAVYQAAGRTDDAADSYRRALALNPNSAEAHHNLGLALWDRAERAKAAAHLERALALKPDYTDARRNLVLLQREESEGAGLEMSRLVYGYWTTQAVSAAAKLGIADLVESSPRTADELAIATKTHAPSLQRLLLFLASLGVFTEDPQGRFQQSVLSCILQSHHPYSMRDRAAAAGHPETWAVWGDLHETIVTGQPAFERAYGASFFDHLAKAPGGGTVFNEQMTSASTTIFSSILGAYDFSKFTQAVDVGGGTGALLYGLLSAYPNLRGILADRLSVSASASALKSAPFAARCEIVEADFFASVPAGGDLYLLKKVLHDWTDEDAVKILGNCRKAIRPDGTLLVIEMVLKPSNQFDTGRWADLEMLMLLKGRERSEADFAALFQESGFVLSRIVETGEPMSILEGRPV